MKRERSDCLLNIATKQNAALKEQMQQLTSLLNKSNGGNTEHAKAAKARMLNVARTRKAR